MSVFTSADTGCYLDGSQGWHNLYRIVELAQAHGMVVSSQDVEDIARYQESHSADAGECMGYLADQALDHLNSLCDETVMFGWYDGDLMLWTWADWEDDLA